MQSGNQRNHRRAHAQGKHIFHGRRPGPQTGPHIVAEQPAGDRNLGENRCHQNQGNSQGRPPPVAWASQISKTTWAPSRTNRIVRAPYLSNSSPTGNYANAAMAKTSPVAAPIRVRSPAAAINRSPKNFGKEIVMTLKTSPPNSAATQMTLNTTTWVRTLPLASTFFLGWGFGA